MTQSAKKEMAEAEKAEQQRLDQRTKLEHAKAYRKQLSTTFREISDPAQAGILWQFRETSLTALVQEGEGGEEAKTQPVMDVRILKDKYI